MLKIEIIRKIKYHVRTHLGKRLWHLFVDCKFHLRNWHYLKKLRWKPARQNKRLYFVIDNRLKHPGLADRFKAIIGCYYLAKINDLDFKIIYKTPFKLEDYLSPNKVDWLADFADLDYSIMDTRFLNYSDWHGLPSLKKEKQYHCYNYIGNDILLQIPNSKVMWSNLFHELFQPTKILSDAISNTGLKLKSYIAVHLRFVNALDNFESGHFNGLNEEHAIDLIERCKKAIEQIYIKYGKDTDVICFSDSKRFLDSIKESPIKILDSTSIGHICFNNDENHILKSFLDFYLISRSIKVFRIFAPEMYVNTCYSLYAGIMGECEVEDLWV